MTRLSPKYYLKSKAKFRRKIILTYIFVLGFFASTPNYNRINEWPLQFLRTGYYNRSYGYLASRTTTGFWWSGTAGSATDGRDLNTRTGYVYAQNNYWRGDGFALRCVPPATTVLMHGLSSSCVLASTTVPTATSALVRWMAAGGLARLGQLPTGATWVRGLAMSTPKITASVATALLCAK